MMKWDGARHTGHERTVAFVNEPEVKRKKKARKEKLRTVVRA